MAKNKDKRKAPKPPPTLAVRAMAAAKKTAEKFARDSMREIADVTFKSYHDSVAAAIKKVADASLTVGGEIVAEEVAWMELSATEREARLSAKAQELLLKDFPSPADIEALDSAAKKRTLADARRRALKVLKREAAKKVSLSPSSHAELTKDLLGLYRGQARAALEYRAQLIRSGASPKTVERLFKKLVKEKLEYRARMIGGYETRKEAYTLQRGRWAEQMRMGELSRKAQKFVVVQPDACPICQRIKAQQGPAPTPAAPPPRPFDVFTKAGELRNYRVGTKVLKGKVWGQRWVPGPPFHINCRCYEKLIVL